jgi:hypothetical protein
MIAGTTAIEQSQETAVDDLDAIFAIQRIDQVGMVVADLEQTMWAYWEQFRIGPWHRYTYGPPLVQQMTYRGRRQDDRMLIASARCGDLQLELIQPLAGPSIYDEFVAQCGQGLHHVGVYVPHLDTAIQSLEARGYELIQSGRGYGTDGDGGYAYFDTAGRLAVLLEIIELPAQRRPPEAIFS